MIKKVTILLIAFALTLLTSNFVFADGKQPPPSGSKKGNFSKREFSNSNAWSNNGKGTATPTPGSRGHGDEINGSISGGLAFLILGSLVYLIKRVRDENE